MEENVADIIRQIEFGNASIQAQAFSSLCSLIKNNAKTELARKEKFSANAHFWSCLLSEHFHLIDWTISTIISYVERDIFDRQDAVRRLIQASEKCKRCAYLVIIQAIGRLTLENGKITNPKHPFLTLVVQQPGICPSLMCHLDEILASDKRSSMLPLIIRLIIGPELSTVHKHHILSTLSCNSRPDCDLLIRIWPWSPPNIRLRILPLLSLTPFNQHRCQLLYDSQFNAELTPFLLPFGTSNPPCLLLPHLLRSLPIHAISSLLKNPTVQCLLQNPQIIAFLLPSLLQLYSVVSELTTVQVVDVKIITIVKSILSTIVKTANSTPPPLKYIPDELSFFKTQSSILSAQLYWLLSDSNRMLFWIDDWLQVDAKNVDFSSVDFISAVLFFFGQDVRIVTLCTKLLAKFTIRAPTLSNYILPLLMHKYGQSSNHELKTVFLTCLPTLTTHRLTVGPVLKLLLNLCKSSTTRITALQVLGDLWSRHEHLFGHLESLLLNTNDDDDSNSEWMYAKVRLMHRICTQSGADYGEQLLTILSNLVNRSPTDSNERVTSTAIMAISELCHCEVIELPTTWKMLWSKLRGDDRPMVQTALCQLLSEAAIGDQDEKFVIIAITQLWSFVSFTNSAIQSAAFKSLAKFDSTLFTMAMLPASAKVGIRIPKALVDKLAIGQNPEEALDFIPALCYVNLLNSLSNETMEGYSFLLSSLIQSEVSQIGRPIYTSKVINSTRKCQSPLMNVAFEILDRYLEGNSSYGADKFLCLHTFGLDKNVNIGQSSSFAKKAQFSHGRTYLQVFARLLFDISIDVANWRQCLSIFNGWIQFVSRMYDCVLESRRAELQMISIKRISQEQQKRLDCAWLWTRDQLVQIADKAANGSKMGQLNAHLALMSLAIVVDQHNTDSSCQDPGVYVSHAQWMISVVETLLISALPDYRPKSWSLFPNQQLQYLPTTLLSCFSLLSISRLLTDIFDQVKSFLGPVDRLLYQHLNYRRNTGNKTVAEQLCLSWALGFYPEYDSKLSDINSIGEALGHLISYSRQRTLPSVELAESISRMFKEMDQTVEDCSIYSDVVSIAAGSTGLIRFMTEKVGPNDDFYDLFELMNGRDQMEAARALRRCFRNLFCCSDEHTRGDIEKKLAEVGKCLLKQKTPSLTLQSALLDGLSCFVSVSSSSDKSDLPTTYDSRLPTNSLLRVIVSKLNQIDSSPSIRLCLDSLLLPTSLRSDKRRFPPLNWTTLLSRLPNDLTLRNSLFNLSMQEENVEMCCRFLDENSLVLLPAAMLATHLSAASHFLPSILLLRAFTYCFEFAQRSSDSNIFETLWKAICETTKNDDPDQRKIGLQWMDIWIDVLLNLLVSDSSKNTISNANSISAPNSLIFDHLGDLTTCWTEKERIHRLTVSDCESVNKAIQLRCLFLRNGSTLSSSPIELLDLLRVCPEDNTILSIMTIQWQIGCRFISNSDRQRWIFELLTIGRTYLNDVHHLPLVELCISLLTTLLCGWSSQMSAIPIVGGRPRNSEDYQILWTFILGRLPFAIEDLIKNDEYFRAISDKIAEWAADVYFYLRKCESSSSMALIRACLSALLSVDPELVHNMDEKNFWDCVIKCDNK